MDATRVLIRTLNDTIHIASSNSRPQCGYVMESVPWEITEADLQDAYEYNVCGKCFPNKDVNIR